MSSSRQNGWGRRTIGVTSAFALSLGALPLMASPAAAAALIDLGPACANAPQSTLTDADTSTTPAGESDYATVIDCLNAANGYKGENGAAVLSGTTAGTADMASNVNRAQFAGIFSRIVEAAGLATDESATTPFTDIDGLTFEGNIRAMYKLNLTAGTTATTYGPQSGLTVAQLSTFYVRLIELITGKPLVANGTSDVTGFGVHTDNGEKLFDNGFLTAGQAADGTKIATRGAIFAMGARSISHFVTAGKMTNPFPVPSNATFAVTPSDAAVIDLGGTTVSRQYSATVPSGTVVSIRLFSAGDVTDNGGQFTFADADSDNLADANANAGRITVVNGVAQVAAQQINDVTSGGTVTFTVGTAGGAANVIPVVWADPTAANGGDDRLGLTVPTPNNASAKKPSEAFGVGGRTNFVPAEATLATHNVTVTSTDLSADFFTGTGGTPTPATYYYDSNDVFQKSGVGITMAQFEAILSATDVVSAAYAPDPANVSTFNVTTDNGPAAPTGVSATVGNFDSGTTNNDVKLTYTKSTTDGATQTIRRVLIDGVGADNCTETGTTLATGHTAGTYTDSNLANGTYLYCVKAVQGSGSVVSESADVATANQVVPGPGDVTAPTTFYVAATTDAGFANEGDAGDVIRFILDEPIAIHAGDKIRLLDGNNATVNAGEEQFDLTNGTGSTWDLNATGVSIGGTSYAAGRVLTITLTASPTPNAAVVGGNNRLDYPATVMNQSGIVDLAGNPWNVTTTDRLVNLDTATPSFTIASATDATETIVLTYNTLVACADTAATRAQFKWVDTSDPAPGISPTTITCNNTGTVTLVFTGATALANADLGTLTYTQSGTVTNRVQGLNGRDALSPQSIAAINPA